MNMSFLWPALLPLLLLIPLLAVVYLLLLRRRRRALAGLGGFGMPQAAAGKGPGVRRHIPPVFFISSLAFMTFALARPQSTVNLPTVEGTVVLVFDVSGSMSATDIQPTRMDAAREAALGFVDRQPATVQVGVVAFSDGGISVVPPTNNKADLIAAINRLSPQRGTSLASGIHSGLDLIARSTGQESQLEALATPDSAPLPPAAPGSAGVIVLLTDGENNMSPDPLEAAQVASDMGVRIDTIGVGSPEGVTMKINGFVIHTQLDEETLKQISSLSSGTYFNARSGDDLRAVFDGIQPRLVMNEQKIEVTSLFTALGMLLLLLGGAFSLLWFGRVP